MSRVLITGMTGLLGSYLGKTLPHPYRYFGERFNILDKDETYKAFDRARPDIVIHCAGEGRVDFAETNRCEAWRNTYEGTSMMVRASHYWAAHFVYISTNAVYNGKQYPSNEDTLHDPVNVYGRYKSECELMVHNYGYKSTIIRPILLYGWPQGGRDNMATRLIKSLQSNAVRDSVQLPVDNEIISQPTYAYDCAQAIWKIIAMQKEQKEEFNVAASERMTLFKFAAQVAKTFGLDGSPIVPVPTSEIKVPAKRPRDTTFGLEKIHSMGITLRNPAEGLAVMKAERE